MNCRKCKSKPAYAYLRAGSKLLGYSDLRVQGCEEHLRLLGAIYHEGIEAMYLARRAQVAETKTWKTA